MKRPMLTYPPALLAILLAVLFLEVRPAGAQERPECPSGFFWRASSGVGCMQEGCLDMSNAKYSYTGACICLEGYRGCYESVDTGGVDCGPFCPVSKLTACVASDASCPGEEPLAAPEAGSGDAPPEADEDDAPSEPDPGPAETDIELRTDELVRDLEEFLAGGRGTAPSAGQAAAAGMATATLIATWVLINLLSGARPADVLRAVSQWRGQRAAEPEAAPGGDGTGTASEVTAPTSEDAPARADSADPSPARDTGHATSPEAAERPPDLPALRRMRVEEMLEAKRRIDLLHQLQKRLDEEYRRLVTEWEVARRCAVFDGVLDIADIYLGLRGKLTTSTVRSAYGKDLLKRTIKGAFRKAARYRVDGTFELTPEELFEGAHKSLGVQAPGGGALKQLLQNLSEGKGILGYGKGGSGWAKAYGKGVSKVYGPTESVLSLVDGTKKSMGRCEELRQQMSTIRTIFNQSNSALETAQTDLAIAQSSIAAIDKNIAELKQAFPHRFKNL